MDGGVAYVGVAGGGGAIHVEMQRNRPNGSRLSPESGWMSSHLRHFTHVRALPPSHPLSCAHRILQLIVTVFVGLIIIL